MQVNAFNLPRIASSVPVPAYNRVELSPGIVHLGVGGFHRAHEATYLDELFSQNSGLEFGIVGVGLLESDKSMRDVLDAQDCLYTLMEKSGEGALRPRVIGSIVRYLFAPDDPRGVLSVLTEPGVRIVSLTITEGGYGVNQVTGEFEPTSPDVIADIRSDALPRSAFGYLSAALRRRRDLGLQPFTILSCDNIPHNGDVTRRMLTAFVRLQGDHAFADWIDGTVAFPNSMVDRITPGTTERDKARLADEYGVEDRWPVGCEPFKQWVLEDRFPAGRPMLEEVGVQMVDDVEPYELMKLRLLNATHQALCYLGYLAGYRFVHEVCSDAQFVTFLRGFMDEEATPSLPPVPGVDIDSYKATLLERFANPAVSDTVERLCAETSDRIPKFLLPVVRDQLARDGAVRRSALVVAAWARYAEGTDEVGEVIHVVDQRRDELMKRAKLQHRDAVSFLGAREIFGSLSEDPRFVDAYVEALESLHRDGARATVARWSECSHDAITTSS